MFPRAPHLVPVPTKLGAISTITARIACQLGLPVGHVRFRHVAVLGAAMVEAAVTENRQPKAWDIAINADNPKPHMRPDLAPAGSRADHPEQPFLRLRTSATDAAHDEGPLGLGENISH